MLELRVVFTSRAHTATNCNTLQHTATHCNTLQQIAIHCNTLVVCASRVHRDKWWCARDWFVAHSSVCTATHCVTLKHAHGVCVASSYGWMVTHRVLNHGPSICMSTHTWHTHDSFIWWMSHEINNSRRWMGPADDWMRWKSVCDDWLAWVVRRNQSRDGWVVQMDESPTLRSAMNEPRRWMGYQQSHGHVTYSWLLHVMNESRNE